LTGWVKLVWLFQ